MQTLFSGPLKLTNSDAQTGTFSVRLGASSPAGISAKLFGEHRFRYLVSAAKTY